MIPLLRIWLITLLRVVRDPGGGRRAWVNGRERLGGHRRHLLATGLGWEVFQLHRLDYWLRHRRLIEPPNPAGKWGDVVTLVARLHRRKRFHKDRVVQVLREVRRSTAALPDGVVLLNDENEILWFNRTASHLIGLKREDLGLRIDNLLRQPAFVSYLAAEEFATHRGSPWRRGE